MESKYKCYNCGALARTSYIRAKMGAGYNVWNIPCRECGQHTLSQIQNHEKNEKFEIKEK